jgi:hypothetical protein
MLVSFDGVVIRTEQEDGARHATCFVTCDVRKELNIQNVSLSSWTETIKTADEIHYEYVRGLKEGAVVQLCVTRQRE